MKLELQHVTEVVSKKDLLYKSWNPQEHLKGMEEHSMPMTYEEHHHWNHEMTLCQCELCKILGTPQLKKEQESPTCWSWQLTIGLPCSPQSDIDQGDWSFKNNVATRVIRAISERMPSSACRLCNRPFTTNNKPVGPIDYYARIEIRNWTIRIQLRHVF